MAFWLPALLAAQTAGVVVVGARDVPPAAVAKTQAAVEARIEAAGMTLVPATELGRTLGGAAATLDAPARADALGRIEAAKKSLYDGSFAQALAALSEAAEIQDKAPGVPVDDRIATALWRATVLLTEGKTAAAEEAARDAVRLRPDLQVDLDTFAPNVKQAVEAVRASVASQEIAITFARFPESAEISLDDRAVAGRRATAPPGRHWVRVRLAGMNEVAWPVTISPAANVIEARPMTIAMSPETAGKLAGTGLEAAAQAANADALAVLLLSREDVRVRVWSGALSPPKTYPARELPAAEAWTVEALARRRPVAAATPTPRRAPQARLTASAGPRLAIAHRTLRAAGIDPLSVQLTGTGGAIDVHAARASLRASAEGWLVSFAPTTATADLGATSAHAPGGTLAGGRASGGLSTFGGVTLMLGASFEHYRAARLPVDDDIPLFVSQTRIAPELRIAYSPVSIVELGAGVAPVTFVSEEPAGTTGRNPAGGVDLDWRIGATAPWFDPWRVGVRYDGALRRAAFEGPTSATFQPTVEDAIVTELHQSFTIAVSRSF